ncbi:hypothetical protein [Streptomyces sp. NPDC058812]|uniref:hypothetical protein n=1 Tax=unclassified Streptomyces TaxID=2593676 RepID=UPI0036C91EAC
MSARAARADTDTIPAPAHAPRGRGAPGRLRALDGLRLTAAVMSAPAWLLHRYVEKPLSPWLRTVLTRAR